MNLEKVKRTLQGLISTTPLHVEVLSTKPIVSYKNDKGMDMTMMEGVIADRTTSRKFKAYSQSLFPYLKPGNFLMIMNYIAKPSEIILRFATKLARIPKLSIPVPEDIRSKLSTAEESEEKNVEEVEKMETGIMFSAILKILEVSSVSSFIFNFKSLH